MATSKAYGTYHYIVCYSSGKILAIYGVAQRELAFERAFKMRHNAIPCQVKTRTNTRASIGGLLPLDQ